MKLIQSNVRGWLLRKNYINLRHSARTLQQAWRERKKSYNPKSHSNEQIVSLNGGQTSNISTANNNFISNQSPGGQNMALLTETRNNNNNNNSNNEEEEFNLDEYSFTSFGSGNKSNNNRHLSITDPLLVTAVDENSHTHHASMFETTNFLSSTLHVKAGAGIVSLQAATRGMIARKAFSNIRKQAMASVVIQKSLVQHWQQQESNNNT